MVSQSFELNDPKLRTRQLERHGRRGMISAGAIDDERFGMRDNWPAFAQRCAEEGLLNPHAVQRIQVLTAFSELIGNGDRHFENLSLMTDDSGQPVAVSPAYDILPATYSPLGGGIEPALRVVEPSFQLPSRARRSQPFACAALVGSCIGHPFAALRKSAEAA